MPPDRQPLRVVVGSRHLPAAARVFDEAAETLVLTSRDPAVVLKQIYDSGRQHVWLEGGPTLAAAFLKAGMIDEVISYVAPALLGAGRHAVADLGIETIAQAARFTITDVALVVTDVRITMKGVS
jgi:diaminohydroxyphosphoribosylaminopyrimidine deaminase/5-amino-6-(5-phosphoribosylamino)uracil reductase